MEHKRYVLLKVKKGKLDQWKQWCDSLMTTRKKEALESFKYENVTSESCLTFKIGGEDFLLGIAEFDGNHQEPNMDLPINQDHKKQKSECLEYIGEMTMLFDLR